MDDEFATEARRRGMSTAALIRLLLSQQTGVAVADPVDAYALMRRRRIQEALVFDGDFSEAGFVEALR